MRLGITQALRLKTIVRQTAVAVTPAFALHNTCVRRRPGVCMCAFTHLRDVARVAPARTLVFARRSNVAFVTHAERVVECVAFAVIRADVARSA